MPEIMKSVGEPEHSFSFNSLPWLDSDASSCDVIMSSLNIAHDYPDLDEILDVGDSDMIVNGGGTEPTSPTIYDDSYIEDLSHLCSENSEITQQHYKSKINLQPEGIIRHNEDGLLEALRRSMENFESNSFSDLASLSSLNLAFPPNDLSLSPSSDNLFLDDLLMSDQQPNAMVHEDSPSVQEEDEEDELVSVDEQNEEKSESSESMLKQLLLNPNNNYRKEIDSNRNNAEHMDNALGNIGNAHEHKRVGRKMKKKRLPQKPFTELLKHLGTPNNQSSQTTTKPKTRVLNAKKYLRQYGSAPASRVGSPEPVERSNRTGKRTVIKPGAHKANNIKSSRGSRLISPKKPLQVTKVYPISQSSVVNMKPGKKNDKNLNEISFQPSTGKRKGTVLIEPLPKKKRHGVDEVSKKNDHCVATSDKVCHQQPNPDHDYCQKCPVGQEAGNSVSEPLLNPNKVVQWEEYLQRVRAGTRSAPNSPASSPKPKRGASRKSSCGKTTTTTSSKKSSTSTASNQSSNFASPHVTPIIAAKIQANTKPTIKLQEFQEYLTNLKNKRHTNKISSSSSAEIIAPTSTTPIRNAVRIVQTSLPVTTTALSVNLATQQSKPIAPSQPFIKVQSGGKIHTAAVTSAQTLPYHSGPLVMIRIPNASNAPSTNGPSVQNGASTIASPGVSVTRLYTTTNSASLATSKAPSPKIKRVPPKSTSRLKKSAVQSTQTALMTNTTSPQSNISSPKSSAPTFKLITSSKNGCQSKSLILSNVSGQLKEILLSLVQQQQGDKTDFSSSSEQQQKTLQQLLATITNMQKKQTTTNFVPTSTFQPSRNSLSKITSSYLNKTEAPPCHNKVVTNERVLISHPNTSDYLTEPLNSSQALSSMPSSFLSSHKPDTNGDWSSPMHSSTSLNVSDSYATETNFDDIFFNLPPKIAKVDPTHSSSVSTNQNRPFTLVNPYIDSVISSTVDSLLDRVVQACQDQVSTAGCETTATGRCNHSDNVKVRTDQTNRTSSFNDSVTEITSVPPLLPLTTKTDSNSFCSVLDSTVLLEDLLKSSDNEHHVPKELFSCEEVLQGSGAEDQYYNKLPGYLYSGKMLAPTTTQPLDGFESPSTNQLLGDVELGCEVELQNIEYNKLPHYFSSGKLAPREEVVTSHDHLTDNLSGVDVDSKSVPTGSGIEHGDTFYSRLPSYYTCGRAHLVDTVTEPPQLTDDVVTKEVLRRQHEESRLKSEEKQRHRASVRQARASKEVAPSDDRILYSKIPSYLTSGRQSLAPDRNFRTFYPLSPSSSSETDDPTSSWLREKPKRSKTKKKRKKSREEDKVKNAAILERRVMYVGGIDITTTEDDLRHRFCKFGIIDDITLHFRKGKDNYAFITFRYGNDVVRAIEHGNDNATSQYILCFGGRRYFCKVDYADLDKNPNGDQENKNEDDFDTLLQQAMRH